MKLRLWPSFGRSSPVAAPVAASVKPRRSFVRSLAQIFKSAQSQANDDWTGTPITPDSFIMLHHPRLVARSRE